MQFLLGISLEGSKMAKLALFSDYLLCNIRQILDFANVFKSFIGANFMSQPYAFAHAGIAV